MLLTFEIQSPPATVQQRITVHYNYQGLDDDKVKQYIHHKLSVAGGAPSIIDDAAISAAHSYSRGNPRLLDNVMSHALDYGAQIQKQTIDADVMMASIEAQSLF